MIKYLKNIFNILTIFLLFSCSIESRYRGIPLLGYKKGLELGDKSSYKFDTGEWKLEVMVNELELKSPGGNASQIGKFGLIFITEPEWKFDPKTFNMPKKGYYKSPDGIFTILELKALKKFISDDSKKDEFIGISKLDSEKDYIFIKANKGNEQFSFMIYKKYFIEKIDKAFSDNGISSDEISEEEYKKIAKGREPQQSTPASSSGDEKK